MSIKDFCRKHGLNYPAFLVQKHRFKENKLYSNFFPEIGKVNEKALLKYYNRKNRQVIKAQDLYFKHIKKFKNDKQFIRALVNEKEQSLYNFISYRFFSYNIKYLAEISINYRRFYINIMKYDRGLR